MNTFVEVKYRFQNMCSRVDGPTHSDRAAVCRSETEAMGLPLKSGENCGTQSDGQVPIAI